MFLSEKWKRYCTVQPSKGKAVAASSCTERLCYTEFGSGVLMAIITDLDRKVMGLITTLHGLGHITTK